jgi:hypothetical protein
MRRADKILTGLLAAACAVTYTSGNVPVPKGTPPHTTAQSSSTPAPSNAMRRARPQMIAGDRLSTPDYWAPFVLVGGWR